jgi:hypothetical protein
MKYMIIFAINNAVKNQYNSTKKKKFLPKHVTKKKDSPNIVQDTNCSNIEKNISGISNPLKFEYKKGLNLRLKLEQKPVIKKNVCIKYGTKSISTLNAKSIYTRLSGCIIDFAILGTWWNTRNITNTPFVISIKTKRFLSSICLYIFTICQ